MRNIILLLAWLLLMGLVGCESEADRQAQVLAQQHHLYNLKVCEAETIGADRSLGDMDILKNDTDGQRSHDYRAAECMAVTEHTTSEYQRAKHDDYGKVNVATNRSNVHDIPEER